MTAALDPSSPFKFLEYYVEADAAVFGGRERESIEIADRLTQARTYIFYGRSGLGKTSVLLAGVFPELRRRNWLPIHIRTLADPARDLLHACEALHRQLQPDVPLPEHSDDVPTPRRPPSQGHRTSQGHRLSGGHRISQGQPVAPPSPATRERILTLLRTLPCDNRVVLALDQFEEFFIRFRAHPEVRAEFVSIIAAIARDRQIPVHVVFSLREDYLAEMDDFRSELPELFEDEYRLRAMTAFGVREAVTRPLDAAGVPYQGRLVTRLLDRLSERRFDPVVLQILCNEVYQLACARAQASGGTVELRADDLDAVGDIDQVFRRYLDTAASHLDGDQQLVARGVLRCMTTQEHTKQALQLHDFTEAFVRISEHEAAAVLELLAHNRLIRIDRRGQDRGEAQTWYELTHDRLVPIITEWLRLDVEFNRLLAAEDLISTSVRSGLWREGSENLLGPGHLDNVVGPFRTRLRLSPDKLEFVLRSAVYHHHEDTADWARDFENASAPGASGALVLELLHSHDDQMRGGAVYAAGQLPKLHEQLATELVNASLLDIATPVRRAAGRAIGYARSPRLINKLLEQGQHVDSKRVVAVLADVYASGQDLTGVPRWLRWRAQQLATRRTARQHHEQIAEARPVASIGAVLAGVFWIIALLPYGLIWSFGYAADEPKDPIQVFWLSGGVLAAIVATCVPVAGAAGGAAVLRSRARGHTTWTATITGTWTYRAIAMVLAFVVVPVLTVSADWLWGGSFDNALLIMCLAASFWLAMPLTVALGRRAIWGEQSFARANMWSVLSGLGLPLAIPWACIGFTEGRQAAVIGIAGLVWSAMTATISAGLARVGVEMPNLDLLETAERDRARAWTRGALLGLVLTSFTFVLISVGPGVIPWPRSDGDLGAGEELNLAGTLDPYGGVQANRYHHIRVEAGDDPLAPNRLVVDVTASAGSYGVYSDGAPIPGFWAPLDGQSHTLLVEPGRHAIAFVATDARTDYQLQMKAGEVLQTGELALRDSDVVYAWTRWTLNDLSNPGDALAGADIVSSLTGTAGPLEVVRVSFGERFVVDSKLDQAEFTGMQLHCQGDVVGAQPVPAGTSSRFASDGPFVEAPSFDAELASTCTTYSNAAGVWTIRFGATLSHSPGAQLEGVRMAVAVKREPNDGNLRQTNSGQADMLVSQQLAGENLGYVDFSNKSFRASSFRNAELSGVNFRFADLGVDAGNETAEAAPERAIGNDFTAAHGNWADFSGAVLVGADFTNAQLPSGQFQGLRRATDARFIGATLSDANFEDARIAGADFSAAKLPRASFKNAQARATSFRDTNLEQTDFTGADLREVDFTGADLRGATLDLRSSETDSKPIFDNADVADARILVNNPKLRIKDVCGTGKYTLVVSELDKSGTARETTQEIELPTCGKSKPTVKPTPPAPAPPELLRGACRSAPLPVGIYRNHTREAEEICRQSPARSTPSDAELIEGRQTWTTDRSLEGIQVVCSCELRSAYVSTSVKGDRGGLIIQEHQRTEQYMLRGPSGK